MGFVRMNFGALLAGARGALLCGVSWGSTSPVRSSTTPGLTLLARRHTYFRVGRISEVTVPGPSGAWKSERFRNLQLSLPIPLAERNPASQEA
jgi:hypothetical protein